jgi:hypothetical protein
LTVNILLDLAMTRTNCLIVNTNQTIYRKRQPTNDNRINDDTHLLTLRRRGGTRGSSRLRRTVSRRLISATIALRRLSIRSTLRRRIRLRTRRPERLLGAGRLRRSLRVNSTTSSGNTRITHVSLRRKGANITLSNRISDTGSTHVYRVVNRVIARIHATTIITTLRIRNTHVRDLIDTHRLILITATTTSAKAKQHSNNGDDSCDLLHEFYFLLDKTNNGVEKESKFRTIHALSGIPALI